MVKVSIITVCYNSEKTIRDTIESVVSQNYSDIEYIIVDGKSQDKTLSIVESYGHSIAKIISEKDRGMYDAMNKAIAKTNGNWLYFLGADDEICKDSFQNIFSQDWKDANLIFGNIKYQNNPKKRELK